MSKSNNLTEVTYGQIKTSVEAILALNPSLSNRAVGEMIGYSDETVRRVRATANFDNYKASDHDRRLKSTNGFCKGQTIVEIATGSFINTKGNPDHVLYTLRQNGLVEMWDTHRDTIVKLEGKVVK